MLATDAPRTPGSGRSRFSKVLPAPPPPTERRPPSKALPPVPLVLPQYLARKPVRKPVVSGSSNNSSTLSPSHSQPQTPISARTPATPNHLPPLPALPFETDRAAPPPPPPPMSIPRRPVVPPKQNPPAPQPHQPQPLPKLQTDLGFKPVAQPRQETGAVSPAGSFGSLLSAYSRSSAGESNAKSSEGFASHRNSESTLSPDTHEEVAKSWKSGKDSFAPLPTIPQEEKPAQALQQPLRQQSASSRKALPRPPPPPPPAPAAVVSPTVKDDLPPPPTPKKDSIYVAKNDSPVSVTNTSPLWRRRSLKTDRSIQLPDLHLANLSHGSTAASQASSQSTIRTAPLALGAGTLSSQSSKSTTTNTASSTKPWQPPPKTYVSPVNEVHSPEHRSVPSESTTSPVKPFAAFSPLTQKSEASGTPFSRVAKPTNDAASAHAQESEAQDTMGGKQSKLKAQMSSLGLSKLRRSPKSPTAQQQQLPAQPQFPPRQSSAIPPQQEQAVSPAADTPRLPTPDYQKQDVRPDTAEPVISPMSPAAPPTPPQEDAKRQASGPIQRKAVGAVPPEAIPAQSMPQIVTNHSPPLSNGMPSPLPPPSIREFRPPSPGGPPGSPGSYYGGNGFRRGPGPGPGPGPRPGPAYRPVITDFRELREEDLPPPDPRALYFPKTVAEPASPSTVFEPFPLGRSHMDCHIGHRIMKPSRNVSYALACQTCHVADRNERWACSACHVRVCGACYRTLNGNGRNLPLLLEQLQGMTSPGQMSQVSPTS